MIVPEHLHLALNHLPFLGSGFALIPLAIGLLLRNRPAAFAGLLTAALSGWVTPFVMETGESAYERYEEGPVAAYLDPGAEGYLEEHERLAERWSKAIYASAVVSTIGLAILVAKPGATRLVSPIAAVFCVASLLSGFVIARSGGLIRRPDFRPGAVVEAASEEVGERRGHHDDGRND